MKKIYKYPLDLSDTVNITMPAGAEILCVSLQGNHPYIWARVNTDNVKVRRAIRIRGTGHECCDDPYIGTLMFNDGALVFHVFDGGDL